MAVVDKWDTHVHVIDKVVPANWKVCITHFCSVLVTVSSTHALLSILNNTHLS